MAMMDNAAFLISHIRNSFITSDDTGMCEVILEPEQLYDSNKRRTTWHGKSENVEVDQVDGEMDVDAELPHSYDILADMVFDSHRRRSNTAQKLEKLKREKQKQSKIKHIQWKNTQYKVDEIGEYFIKKELKTEAPPRKSMLSLQLEQISPVPDNPYMSYSKFDGRSNSSAQTKKIEIFLTMLPVSERAFPMTVVTLTTAKVQDLIGLICWQYYADNRSPTLTTQIEAFALHIAEDDGDVDMDFPALDNKEPISKFGFFKLALVQKHISEALAKTETVIHIDLQHRGKYKMSLENEQILMKEILEKVLEKHGLSQKPGLEYRLEKSCEPRVPIDVNLPLNAMGTYNFYLIRENSARVDTEGKSSPTTMSEMAKSLSSMRYQSFVVNMTHKLRINREVHLGISGDKVEIDPLASKKLFKIKPKPVTIDTEDIAACSLDSRHSSKSAFRLVYQINHEFKHHDFECESGKANDIVQKINNIIEMRSSPVRKDYQAYRDKKALKKSSSSS